MPVAHLSNLIHTQNFLTNARLIDELLDRSSIGPADLVYEIGAGTGTITERLAARCRLVIAIEKDACLADALKRRFATQAQVVIRTGDFLDEPLPARSCKVFSSPPFDITAAIVNKLTHTPNPPDDTYLVLQREAANRFVGVPRGSLRAALLAPWFTLEVLHRFRRGDFSPPPSVDVVLLRIAKRGPPLVAPRAAARYRDFVTYAFTAWLPTVGDVLRRLHGGRAAIQVARAAGVDPSSRPGNLAPERWPVLFLAFQQVACPQALRIVSGAATRLAREQARIRKVHRSRTSERRLNRVRRV